MIISNGVTTNQYDYSRNDESRLSPSGQRASQTPEQSQKEVDNTRFNEDSRTSRVDPSERAIGSIIDILA
jgi:hypothetical protein